MMTRIIPLNVKVVQKQIDTEDELAGVVNEMSSILTLIQKHINKPLKT